MMSCGICGFIPVAFSQGMASEFCGALFPVIGIALLLSWIVSVMVAPLYGTYLIKLNVATDENGRPDPYQSRFYKFFRSVLGWFLTHKKTVLVGTALLFAVSVFFMHFTKEQADYGGNGALIAAKLSPVLGQLAPAVPGLAEKLDIKNLQIPGQDDFYRTSIVGGIGVTFKF